MTAAPARRVRHRWHAPEKGSGPAFALSLLAHAVLFIAIAFMVRWKSEPVAAVSAELWTLPPAAVQQPTPPPPPPRPVQIEPPPPPPEPRKAEIVMEQKKVPLKVEVKKVAPTEPPKKQDTKTADLKRAAEEKKAEQQQQAEREAAAKATLNRVLAQAGPASGTPGPGSSNAYRAQVAGCIRPHIIFNVPDGVRPQQYVAEFEVMLLPTGEQATEPKLLKASGLAPYDQAVERAIRRCNPFPPPKEGTMPRSVRLSFDPIETR
ncbi:MAG TPA: TonB C-terminal domain-containing protein [Burkholderiaceae bacterium]|nr:TonB C-terminal domain-containing protein [Burkholderiaceae bacterium]